MQIDVEWLGDEEAGLADLEAHLRQDPRLDDARIARGRPAIPPSSLGAQEILEIVATNVGLGVVANALYDFLRARARTGAANARLRLRRTDADKDVIMEYDGPAAGLERIVRDALADD